MGVSSKKKILPHIQDTPLWTIVSAMLRMRLEKTNCITLIKHLLLIER